MDFNLLAKCQFYVKHGYMDANGAQNPQLSSIIHQMVKELTPHLIPWLMNDYPIIIEKW